MKKKKSKTNKTKPLTCQDLIIAMNTMSTDEILDNIKLSKPFKTK